MPSSSAAYMTPPRTVHTGLYGKEAETLCRLALVCGTIDRTKDYTKRSDAGSAEADVSLFTSFGLELVTVGGNVDLLETRPLQADDTIPSCCQIWLHGIERIYLDSRNEVCFLVDYRWNDGKTEELFDDSGSLEKLLCVFRYIRRRLLEVDTPGCQKWKAIVTWKMTAELCPKTCFDSFSYTVSEEFMTERIFFTKEDLDSLVEGFEKVLAGEQPDRRSRLFKPETNPIAIEANSVVEKETKKEMKELAERCCEKVEKVSKAINTQFMDIRKDIGSFVDRKKLRFD